MREALLPKTKGGRWALAWFVLTAILGIALLATGVGLLVVQVEQILP